MSARIRVVVAKGDERVDGPDDAEVEFTVPLDVVTEDGFDATVEFMRGRLKVAGPSGAVFEVLATGEVDDRSRALAAED